MNEMMLGIFASVALGVCVIDCLFWMWGGRKGKWKRRYIGSALQTIAINVISFLVGTWVWQFALSLVPEIASRTLGYGGDTIGEKIMRRSVFAAGSLVAGVCLAWGLGFSHNAIIILICQAIASIVSIVLGVWNPVPAAVEETFVCLSLKYINYFFIFVI